MHIHYLSMGTHLIYYIGLSVNAQKNNTKSTLRNNQDMRRQTWSESDGVPEQSPLPHGHKVRHIYIYIYI